MNLKISRQLGFCESFSRKGTLFANDPGDLGRPVDGSVLVRQVEPHGAVVRPLVGERVLLLGIQGVGSPASFGWRLPSTKRK